MTPSFVGRAGVLASLLPSLLVGLQACSAVPGVSSDGLPRSPLFPSEPQVLVRYEEALPDQNEGQSGCKEDREVCAGTHFNLALAALYRNQAEAASHFRTVIEQAPDSPEADASQAWLQLLFANTLVERPRLFPRATEQLVRQYLSLAFRERQRIQELEETKQKLKQEKQELEARSRDVEKLTRQLEALKRIDQEIEDLREKTRPSPTIPPPSGIPAPK